MCRRTFQPPVLYRHSQPWCSPGRIFTHRRRRRHRRRRAPPDCPGAVRRRSRHEYSEWGNTPLHLAAACGHHKTVRVLLEFRAAKEAGRPYMRFPLHPLVGYKFQENIRFGPREFTSLHLAVENGHYKTVRVLLELGADKEAKDNGEYTVLYWAASRGDHKIAWVLLECRANKEAGSNEKHTPLHLVVANGRQRDGPSTSRIRCRQGGKRLEAWHTFPPGSREWTVRDSPSIAGVRRQKMTTHAHLCTGQP